MMKRRIKNNNTRLLNYTISYYSESGFARLACVATDPTMTPLTSSKRRIRMTEGIFPHQERIARDPQLLRRKIDAVNMIGVVGERRNIGIVLSIIASRLILCEDEPEQLAGINVGHHGSGKSFVVDKSRALYPADQFFVLSNATAKSFYNLRLDLKNKVLVIDEAQALKREGELAMIIRLLISGGRASYQRTVRKAGETLYEKVEVEGPIAFLSTTNTPILEAQLGDRLIKIQPDTTAAQTKRIMQAKAARAKGEHHRRPEQVKKFWQDFNGSQQPCSVVIPYAPEIEVILSEGQFALSARRAFPRFLSVIKAITILYQYQRNKDEHGRLIADIADYAMAYQLFSSTFLQDTDPGICELTEQRLETIRSAGKITITELAKLADVSKQAISDWANGLLESGKLFWCDAEDNPFRTRVLEKRAKNKGTAFLRCVNPSALPSPYDLTGDPAWREGGALYELYDLDLEGVNAPVSYEQSGTGVGYEEIPVFTEIPHTTAQNALMLYRPAV